MSIAKGLVSVITLTVGVTVSTPVFARDCSIDCARTFKLDVFSRAECFAWKERNCAGDHIGILGFLFGSVSPTYYCQKSYNAWISATIGACAATGKQYYPGREIDILVDQGYFSRHDFKDVRFRVCRSLNPFASGMAPAPNTILFSENSRTMSLQERAALLAHEMRHLQQQNRDGFETFGCYYAEMYATQGQATFGCKNRYEFEAYNFEDQVLLSLSGQTTDACQAATRRYNARVNLNIRERPSASSSLVGTIEAGKCVDVGTCRSRDSNGSTYCAARSWGAEGRDFGYIAAEAIVNGNYLKTLGPSSGCERN